MSVDRVKLEELKRASEEYEKLQRLQAEIKSGEYVKDHTMGWLIVHADGVEFLRTQPCFIRLPCGHVEENGILKGWLKDGSGQSIGLPWSPSSLPKEETFATRCTICDEAFNYKFVFTRVKAAIDADKERDIRETKRDRLSTSRNKKFELWLDGRIPWDEVISE